MSPLVEYVEIAMRCSECGQLQEVTAVVENDGLPPGVYNTPTLQPDDEVCPECEGELYEAV